MIEESQKQEILKALPQWIEEDPAFRIALARMLRGEFADRQQTESRFEQLLAELRRDREIQTRKWEEQTRKWEENEHRWQETQAESERKWEEMKAESERKWEEMKAESERKWEEMKAESDHKWEENQRTWQEMKAESDRRWQAHCDEFEKVHQEIMAISDRLDRKLSAMGARWGIASERAFRHALAGILEKTFGVRVLNVNEFDKAGEVFGRPDQVELDIVIKNGNLLILELKSSMSKSDVYIFERKARFYEKHHDQQADRLIIVSPMVDERAMKTANALNIEVYSDADEVQH